MKFYKVGGAVRDSLLNLTVKDIDWVVVGGSPKQMIELGFKPVGKDFPVFLHPKTREEYALARTERKTAQGYHGFEFYTDETVTLEDDLKRRDLTINAMAIDPETNELIDLFNGQHDLKHKILRHISSAFKEDPVRILRIAKFSARFGFDVAEETNFFMQEMVENGEVKSLVAERIWQELYSALNENQPSLFFYTLQNCGALKVLFPEIHKLFGVPQTETYHPEIDTGVHVMMVIDQSARFKFDPIVRFCALVHDLGKGITPKKILPKHINHESRGVPLVDKLCERLRVPKDFKNMAKIVTQEHTLIHRALELRPETILELFYRIDSYRRPERIEYLAQACIADHAGRKGFEDKPYPQADYVRQVYQVSNQIDKKDISERFKNHVLEINHHIRLARLEQIKIFIKEYRENNINYKNY